MPARIFASPPGKETSHEETAESGSDPVNSGAVVCRARGRGIWRRADVGQHTAGHHHNNVLRADFPAGDTATNPGTATVLGSAIPRMSIASVSFLDALSGAPSDAWDASADQSGSVMAWVAPTEISMISMSPRRAA